MKDKPTEKDIIAFISKSDLISPDKFNWIKSWIESDLQLSNLANWYREYYSEYIEVKENDRGKKRNPRGVTLYRDISDNKIQYETVLVAKGLDDLNQPSDVIFYSCIEALSVIIWIRETDSQQSKLVLFSRHLKKGDIARVRIGNHTVLLENGEELTATTMLNSNILNVLPAILPSVFLELPLGYFIFYHDSLLKSVTYSIGSFHVDLDPEVISVEINHQTVVVSFDNSNDEKRISYCLLKSGSVQRQSEANSGTFEFQIKELTTTRSTLHFF